MIFHSFFNVTSKILHCNRNTIYYICTLLYFILIILQITSSIVLSLLLHLLAYYICITNEIIIKLKQHMSVFVIHLLYICFSYIEKSIIVYLHKTLINYSVIKLSAFYTYIFIISANIIYIHISNFNKKY